MWIHNCISGKIWLPPYIQFPTENEKIVDVAAIWKKCLFCRLCFSMALGDRLRRRWLHVDSVLGGVNIRRMTKASWLENQETVILP